MSDPTAVTRLPVPVFLHAMWRTGSTYFWHKFRLQPAARAFMEPLHEYLFNMSEQQLRDFLPVGVTGLMRHPEIDRFYFDEYAFQSSGGVPHFQKYFSYQRYCLDPDDSDPLLEAYIQSLLQLAWQHGQQPILQFNRGLLRAGWLAKRFKSHTILLVRRPFDTWKSFLSFKNLYFPTVMCMIVGQNVDDPTIRQIGHAHDIPSYVADSLLDEYHFYHNFVESRLDRLYPVFHELSILANVHAAAYADIVIDINEVATNATARAFVTSELRRIGIDISLDDCLVPVYTASTPEEKMWLSAERTSGLLLRTHQGSPLRIPAGRVSALRPGLGGYWREVFDEYSL